ncbi:MAG: hypothetical protein WCE64_16920 [Bacteroidales bacterium]
MLDAKKPFNLYLQLALISIPVAFISYLFHEFGHWSVGEIMGNRMAYRLNGAWPVNGQYLNPRHGLYSSIAGPAFSILQALIALIFIEKLKSIYAFPFLFFPLFMRFFSITFGGFNKQDEAGISASLGIGTYTVAILVIVISILIIWRGAYKLKLTFKEVNYFILISTLCDLLVIGTDSLLK